MEQNAVRPCPHVPSHCGRDRQSSLVVKRYGECVARRGHFGSGLARYAWVVRASSRKKGTSLQRPEARSDMEPIARQV